MTEKKFKLQTCRISSCFIFIMILLLACAPALYVPTEEQALQSGIPLSELKEGRKLYVDHCGSCHMLYLPGQFTDDQWRHEMVVMRQKVAISERDESLILQYLLAGK